MELWRGNGRETLGMVKASTWNLEGDRKDGYRGMKVQKDMWESRTKQETP